MPLLLEHLFFNAIPAKAEALQMSPGSLDQRRASFETAAPRPPQDEVLS
jgi:hypothetical protein